MATAVNLRPPSGITIGNAVGSVAEWLRRITVRVGSRPSRGSGVVWTRGGLIVTNAHVASEGSHQVALWDGSALLAELVARDSKMDLAALRLIGGRHQAAFPRSPKSMRPGEMVIAVGNPWDGSGAVSTGILHHAIGKGPWLIADIRLAPGNSGGPLADVHGNVIGISSMVVNGFGCAVSSDVVSEFLRKAGLAERM